MNFICLGKSNGVSIDFLTSLLLLIFQIYAADDAVEIVKAVSPDKKSPNEPEKESDQVALESQDQESHPAILIPHAPPPGSY